jgi:hypothetical protein
MWARRGAEGVEIPKQRNEKLTYTVMVAVTTALTTLPIGATMKGKTTLAEKVGVLDASLWDSETPR